MKRLILVLIMGILILSCGKKNWYKEATNDIEEIIREQEMIHEKVKQSRDKLPEMDMSKLKKLTDNFKRKYENKEIEGESQEQIFCRDMIIKDYPEIINEYFFKIIENRLEIENKDNRMISLELNVKLTQDEMEKSISKQQELLEVCKMASEK